MAAKITLVVPRRAFTRIICENEAAYVDDIYVAPRFRKKGYCTQLLRFAIAYLADYPELDIRYQSLNLQRAARNLGYVKVRRSTRYAGCALWVHRDGCDSPASSLQLARVVRYSTANSDTEVLYLRTELSHGS